MNGIDVMWETVCETLSEWMRFYYAWAAGVIEDVGPASYGFALLAVASFGWLFMKGGSYGS